MKNHLTEILCLFLIIVLLVTKCNWGKEPDRTPRVDSIIRYDTIHRVDTVTEQKTVNSWFAKHDTVFIVQFDTIALSANDCDSVRQTVAFNRDSSVQVTSLTHGRILRQIIESRQVNTTTTITEHPQPFKWALFAGANMQIGSVAPMVELQVRKDKFSVGYNLLNQSPQIGYSRQLFSK